MNEFSSQEIATKCDVLTAAINEYAEAIADATRLISEQRKDFQLRNWSRRELRPPEENCQPAENAVRTAFDRAFAAHAALNPVYRDWKDTLSLMNFGRDVPKYEDIRDWSDVWRLYWRNPNLYDKLDAGWVVEGLGWAFERIERVKLHAMSGATIQDDDADASLQKKARGSKKERVQVPADSKKCTAKILDDGIEVHYSGGKGIPVKLEPRLVKILEVAYRDTLRELQEATRESGSKCTEESFHLHLTHSGIGEACRNSERKTHLNRQDVSHIRNAVVFLDGVGLVAESDDEIPGWLTNIPFALGGAVSRPKGALFSEVSEGSSDSPDISNISEDKIE